MSRTKPPIILALTAALAICRRYRKLAAAANSEVLLIVYLMFIIGLTARTLLLSMQFGGVTPLAVTAEPFSDAPTLDLDVAPGRNVKLMWRDRAVCAAGTDSILRGNPDLLLGRRPDFHDPVNPRVLTTSLSFAGIQAEVTGGPAYCCRRRISERLPARARRDWMGVAVSRKPRDDGASIWPFRLLVSPGLSGRIERWSADHLWVFILHANKGTWGRRPPIG